VVAGKDCAAARSAKRGALQGRRMKNTGCGAAGRVPRASGHVPVPERAAL